MWYHWLVAIAFFLSLGALPKIVTRYKKKKEVSDLLEIVGVACLGVATFCFAVTAIF